MAQAMAVDSASGAAKETQKKSVKIAPAPVGVCDALFRRETCRLLTVHCFMAAGDPVAPATVAGNKRPRVEHHELKHDRKEGEGQSERERERERERRERKREQRRRDREPREQREQPPSRFAHRTGGPPGGTEAPDHGTILLFANRVFCVLLSLAFGVLCVTCLSVQHAG